MKPSTRPKLLSLLMISILFLLTSANSCKKTEQRSAFPDAFLAVAKPSDAPHPAFQDKYGGQTVVFDLRESEKPVLVGAYDDAAIAERYRQSGPPQAQCIPAKPGDNAPVATGGPAGTSRLPGNYPSVGFSGSGGGGCGTWATAVCNRTLGETDPAKAVDQVEWNEIARAIQQNATGGSPPSAVDAYYKSKGFCVETRLYNGTNADRQELGNKFVNDHCDVKLMFYTTNPTPPPALINGHVETVTGITGQGIQTNSWGHDGYVQGGTAGGFSHSRFPVYPPVGTTVFVSYVCKCNIFEKLF